MKAALKKYEGSKMDKAKDKRMGVKEGSRADMKADMAGAKKMMHKSKVRSAATKAFGGKY